MDRKREVIVSKQKNNQYPVDEHGDQIDCSGRYCNKSCTAGVIGNCVAVCCCPCALVNFVALALFKVPYMVTRKCLRMRKKKKKKKKKVEMKRNCVMEDINENLEKDVRVKEEMPEIIASGSSSEEEMDNADKVWFELYQVGHLGFGRVSFTGIQFQNNKSN